LDNVRSTSNLYRSLLHEGEWTPAYQVFDFKAPQVNVADIKSISEAKLLMSLLGMYVVGGRPSATHVVAGRQATF
jgi:hypothetical protein